jgi:hypothetical protein
MKKTTLTIILTSILAFSVSFGQQRPKLAKIIVAKAIKEKVSSGDIVRKIDQNFPMKLKINLVN